MVVLIVLHLYSLLLPYFKLQSVVVVIVWQFLLCYTCIHYYYHASYFSPSWSCSYGSSYCVTLVFTTITMLHTSVRHGRDRIVVLIVLHNVFTTITKLHTSAGSVVVVWQILLCYTCIHYYYHASYFSWIHRGRDRMVVLIVLHLYSLLLPCFILQSVVVVIVWQFLLCYTCIHYYYHTSYFSPSWW